MTGQGLKIQHNAPSISPRRGLNFLSLARKPDAFKVDGSVNMHYRAWNLTQEDNYSHVEVDKPNNTLRVALHGMNGEVLSNSTTGESLVAKLTLAPWE